MAGVLTRIICSWGTMWIEGDSSHPNHARYRCPASMAGCHVVDLQAARYYSVETASLLVALKAAQRTIMLWCSSYPASGRCVLSSYPDYLDDRFGTLSVSPSCGATTSRGKSRRRGHSEGTSEG